MTERIPVSGGETEDHLKKIEGFIEAIAAGYRTEGIPIDDGGRIDMKAYQSLYPDVNQDIERDKEWGREWHGDLSEEAVHGERRRTEGEQLEMLAYAIFAKNLRNRFVVARTASHDDRKNKVDTVLLERATGNLVCAFDEVGDTTGVDYERKQAIIQKHNLEGGASLKYGLSIEIRDGNPAIVPAPGNNIPLFYIALPSDRIKKGLIEFRPETENQSDFESKLFTYFMATLAAQINGLELYSGRLNPELKAKLVAFKKIVNELNSKGEKKK